MATTEVDHMTIMLMNIPIKTHLHGLFLKIMLMVRLLGEMTQARACTTTTKKKII
jgi:hypothetical protein